MIPDLQAVDGRGGQDREQIDVLVPQQSTRARLVVRFGHRRIVVEAEAEIRARELLIVQ